MGGTPASVDDDGGEHSPAWAELSVTLFRILLAAFLGSRVDIVVGGENLLLRMDANCKAGDQITGRMCRV
ncbi:hypothetical protein Ct61P_15235 [Colletotrichum tofieldiae]|nr:hypothetical protein Ct61P_15235 [Colletotrichum tofieldiae]